MTKWRATGKPFLRCASTAGVVDSPQVGAGMLFESLLSRADDLSLQLLLGRPAVRLLRALSGENMSLDLLRSALLSLHTPAALLLDRHFRPRLLELLRPAEARSLAATLQLTGTNAFASLAGLTFKKGSDREKALLDFFGVPLPNRDQRQKPPDVDSAVALYPLYEHQRRAARNVRAFLLAEPHRVLLHMPTGAGKTRVAMSLLSDHLRAHEPTLAVWLAYSEELCEQATQEFLTAWNALGNRRVTLHRFWGKHELDVSSATDGAVIAGLPKLFSAAKSSIPFIDALRQKTSLVVMDEAHSSVAETYTTLLDVLLSPTTTALLGLTATPGRTWNDPSEDAKLAKYFARRKVLFSMPGYDNPVTYLIDKHYLARPTFAPVLYQPGTALTRDDLAAIERHFDIPARVVAKLQDDEQRNLAVVHCAESLIKAHRRVLVFAASVAHSDLIAAVLRARSTNAASLTATTASEERTRLIEMFRSAATEPMVLCNYGVLTAGFDAPQTSAAIIARPTRSLVLFCQMVGRAIRGPLMKGNDTAEVHTVHDPQLPGFGNLADAFLNWEDVWRHEQEPA